MKIKATAKSIRNSFSKVICVGYCDLSYLLRNENPMYYTCGVYGWNADIYYVGNDTVIVTGYRPFGNIRPNYDLTRHYEKSAQQVSNEYMWKDYEKGKEIISALLREYVQKVLENR